MNQITIEQGEHVNVADLIDQLREMGASHVEVSLDDSGVITIIPAYRPI